MKLKVSASIVFLPFLMGPFLIGTGAAQEAESKPQTKPPPETKPEENRQERRGPGHLGILLADVPEALRAHLGVDDGAMAQDVLPGSPAEKAGLRRFDVLLAVDGVASLTMAQAMLPDIILMDVALPGMDGWDAAECLKTHPETQSIPIIALTALALPDDRRRASEARIDGYLTKPVALSRVLEEVERVLCA